MYSSRLFKWKLWGIEFSIILEAVSQTSHNNALALQSLHALVVECISWKYFRQHTTRPR
jgi:hypothetical protein